MVLNDDLLGLEWEVDSSYDFVVNRCGLNIKGLKGIFLKDSRAKEDWDVFVDDNNLKETKQGMNNFLIENGWADCEIIEEILEFFADEYYIDFIDDGGGYWKIYKINRGCL